MNTSPSSWITTQLSEIASWGSGGTPSRSNKGFYGGSIPWFKTGELGPHLIYKSEETITEEALKNFYPSLIVNAANYYQTSEIET